MDLLIKAVAQAPLVAILAYIWYTTRRDMMMELKRLQERVKEKDEQLREFTKVFDRLSVTLELIKDRLR